MRDATLPILAAVILLALLGLLVRRDREPTVEQPLPVGRVLPSALVKRLRRWQA